jgi:hypothetical protein
VSDVEPESKKKKVQNMYQFSVTPALAGENIIYFLIFSRPQSAPRGGLQIGFCTPFFLVFLFFLFFFSFLFFYFFLSFFVFFYF